jgi:sulfite reductase (NADPH) hemoprotein beta-component
MYRYDEFDQTLVDERVAQFRGQVERRLKGKLSDDQFRPLRLMNGLYLQLHAYMLRVAIPYGTLSSTQLRKLGFIARRYDKGYGHFTTRQNIQYNWPRLGDVPDILQELASVQMHAIQTSGNCIRNVTADQYAGVAADEVEDPRIYAEIIRQWSTLHPEFSFLPRKFKIAVTGAQHDRAAIRVHDVGIVIVQNEAGETGFEIWAGGGLGRTPMVGHRIRAFVSKANLLAYLEALMRTYNQFGRRDNLFKARIKILVHEIGPEEFTRRVEDEFTHIDKNKLLDLPSEEIARIQAYFAPPPYEALDERSEEFEERRRKDPAFANWVRTNVADHKVSGYAIANISLKPQGGVPGDMSAEQMDVVADLAERYSFSEIRTTHAQNLVLPYVRKSDLYDVWTVLRTHDLAAANLNLTSDIICCPGLDYCNLANARSIPLAQELSLRFSGEERQREIGELKIKMSGCINACGHHHVGHIGILGVDRKGTEYYQISLGGSEDEKASLGDILGPSFKEEEVADVIEKIIGTYLSLRQDGERFLDTYRRVGRTPFKERIYANT